VGCPWLAAQMKVLVCGGRSFEDYPALMRALDALHAKRPVTTIIHGGARGADTGAADWAAYRAEKYGEDIKVICFYADWLRHGRAAGHKRNQQMLDEAKPDVAVAFPGGPGTADMVRRARAAGVQVYAVDLDGWLRVLPGVP
jgi:predicted Rossmann-fold nucleotide-binding protein